MKKSYPINEKHFEVVDQNESQILIWISEWRYYFFGLIKLETRISWIELFDLTEGSDRDGVNVTGKFDGYIQTLRVKHRNIDNFNLDAEIRDLYVRFQMQNVDRELFNNKVRNILA